MSNVQKIQLMVLLLFILLFFLSYLIHIGRKQIEEKEKNSIFLAGKTRKKSTWPLKAYDFFAQWPITKKFIQKLTRQYEFLLPGNKMEIKKQTMLTAFILCLLNGLVILFLALKPSSFSIYKALITITYLYLINNQALYLILEKREIELDEQFEKFLGDIRHRYQVHGMVDEAIYEVLETAKFPIKLHIHKIYNVINSEDNEEEIQKYNDTAPNRFLKIFLQLSVMMLRYGDKKVDNQSLYLTNLKYLKQELNIEINRKNKAKWLFSGLIFIDIIPILFLEPIKNWAIQCFAELENYYLGAFGIVTVVLVFLTTITGSNMITKLKDTERIEVKRYTILDWLSKKKVIKNLLNNIINKNYGRTLKMQELLKKSGESISVKQFLLKRFLYAMLTFLCCLVISFTVHSQSRAKLLTNVGGISYLDSMMSEEQIEIVKDTILSYVHKYKDSSVSVEEVKKDLIAEGTIKSKEIATLTAQEITHRINLYQYEYYKWYELLIAFLVSAVSFQVPYLILKIMSRVRQMVMEDEVIQFHSIILMLMYIDRMTIDTILEWMENYAVVFKKSVQECINNLQAGDMEALEELKEKEPYEPFVRIIENLQMCDKLSIERAFDEIAVERLNYQENRKLENEIYTNDKAVIGKAIAWIPWVLTVGFYLIIPWVVEGLYQFIGQMEQLTNIYK